MSDYKMFALKGVGYLILIGFAIWWTESATPLWALLLMPAWIPDQKDKNAG